MRRQGGKRNRAAIGRDLFCSEGDAMVDSFPGHNLIHFDLALSAPLYQLKHNDEHFSNPQHPPHAFI